MTETCSQCRELVHILEDGIAADTTLAAIRTEVSVIDRSHVDGWYVAQRVLALLDAPSSPEKG
jgi:hypothetical protein